MNESTPPQDATYLDPDLPLDQRVDDLLDRLTLEEKCGQMLYQAKAVERLGIPEYNWWNECLHGVARAGKATVFPQAIGLGATWDADLLKRIAEAIAEEGRAKHHAAAARGNRGQYRGLTFWTPNINIFRDPRWGRGHETYGEDPYLTGTLGAAFVRGLQGDDPRYMKAAACAKHYAVHSGPEEFRHEFDALASPKDLWETYLPAFKMLSDAGVEAFMGAYNRTNGEPCCGSKTLLVDILREKWGFQGHVVSDCWAVQDFHLHHKVTKTPTESTALAVKMGCDLNCGHTYTHLLEAVKEGLLEEADIDKCVRRLLTTRFKLGMFDPPQRVPFAQVSMDVVNCEAHRLLAYEAAVKSCVLLKNKDSLLPLDQSPKHVLLVGHNASDVDILLGNYYGLSDKLCTVLEGIAGVVEESVNIEYRKGCQLNQPNANPKSWVRFEARRVDVVIAVMGISPMIEGEEGDAIASDSIGDRQDISLPANQVAFLQELHEAGTPIVLVLAGGSALAMPQVHDWCDAILFMWYPGEQGGRAVADILFGNAAPSGKLPITFPMSLNQLPDYEDYSMEGRTYRYMTDAPLYPFGFGLTYTRFEHGDLRLSESTITSGRTVRAEVEIRNTGSAAGEDVVQLYVTDVEASCRTPACSLKGFRRVQLDPGQAKTVSFDISTQMLELIDESGQAVLEPGAFQIIAAGSCPIPRSQELGAPRPAQATLTLV